MQEKERNMEPKWRWNKYACVHIHKYADLFSLRWHEGYLEDRIYSYIALISILNLTGTG